VPSVNFNYSLSHSVATDQWLCWSVVDRDRPSRYALSLWDPPNPRSELCTHLAAEHPRKHNRWGLCPDCSAARQKTRWSWVRSAAETGPLTSPGATKRHPAGKRTPRLTADGCLAEDSSAAAFRGSFIDKVYLGLACFGYCHLYHHTFAEVLAIFDQTLTWYCFPHCVSCRVELLSFTLFHLQIIENICTKFASVTQNWLYFNVRYSL